jgi:hypothetical protein
MQRPIIVSARVFDALNHAGLLKPHGTSSSGEHTWTTFGEDLGDGTVRCELIDGETVEVA